MDARHFDRLTRALSEACSRRGLLGLLASLPIVGGLATLVDDAAAGKGHHRRRKKPHRDRLSAARKHKKTKKPKKKKRKSCTPQSLAQTCTGECGSVKNNCQQTVDCGSCACDLPCEACFVCDEETGSCEPDRNQRGDACGATGQVCQADGACACDDSSCDPCAVCQNDGACSTPCDGAGCCDGDTCVGGASDAACGTDGRVCRQCASGELCRDQQCIACGSGGQPCCAGESCTSANTLCVEGQCIVCGALDDICCPPNNLCIPGARCDQGVCTLCGRFGQPCCGDGNCLELGTTCFLEQCVPCGGRDQLCCGELCGFPYACGAGGVPHICGCAFCTAEENCCAAGQVCLDGSCVACDVCKGSLCRYDSVQQAIDDPTGPSTVRICPGAYGGNVTVSRNLTLLGMGDGHDPDKNTILDAQGSGRVVLVNSGVIATLQGLRITGGVNNADSGAGIRNQGNLTVNACTVAGNSSPLFSIRGGGVYNAPGATLAMTDCTVTDNHIDSQGARGGGIGNDGISCTLTGCTITGNSANFGGGFYSSGASATFDNGTSVTDNTVSDRGGGMFISVNATVTLNNDAIVKQNRAGANGGGVFNNGGTITLNSGASVKDNTAGAKGGGIFNQGGTVSLNAGSAVCANSTPQCSGFASPRGFCAGCPA